MPQERLKILFVGQHDSARERLLALLRRSGYQVDVEVIPPARLSRTRLGRFDFVIADVRGADVTAGPPAGDRVSLSIDGPAFVVTATVGKVRRRSEGLEMLAMGAEGGRSSTSLRALREAARLTQGELARATEMSQPQLSRFESRRDHLVSTLRRYMRALGGDIEVVAVMDGRRVALDDV